MLFDEVAMGSGTSGASRWKRWVLAAAVTVVAVGGGYFAYTFYWRGNFRTVVEGQVYRSAQPSPADLSAWKREYGIRTVINLRGAKWRKNSAIRATREAATAEGLERVDVRLGATRHPPPEQLYRLIEALETAPRPILLHCRAGVNRTGLASAMAGMAVGGWSYDEARPQLSARYLHFDNDPDHIVGVFVRYEQYCREHGLGTGGWEQFKRWVLTEYYPYYYRIEIVAPSSLRVRAGERIELDVTIVNRAESPIPFTSSGKHYNVVVFTGDIRFYKWPRLLRVMPIRRADLAAGESTTVRVDFRAPAKGGSYDLHFDLYEVLHAYFAWQGSPVPTCELTVVPARP